MVEGVVVECVGGREPVCRQDAEHKDTDAVFSKHAENGRAPTQSYCHLSALLRGLLHALPSALQFVRKIYAAVKID